MPPDPLQRCAVSTWRDDASLSQFLVGPIVSRWKDNGELWTVVGRPVAGHGPLLDTVSPGLPRVGRTDGPLGVITLVNCKWRQVPRLYLSETPRALEGLLGADGLVQMMGTGELNVASTITFWRDLRSMTSWAYSKQAAHGAEIAPMTAEKFPRWFFMRFTPTHTEGTTLGSNPLAAVLIPPA